jgi:hypothetical protein
MSSSPSAPFLVYSRPPCPPLLGPPLLASASTAPGRGSLLLPCPTALCHLGSRADWYCRDVADLGGVNCRCARAEVVKPRRSRRAGRAACNRSLGLEILQFVQYNRRIIYSLSWYTAVSARDSVYRSRFLAGAICRSKHLRSPKQKPLSTSDSHDREERI